MAKAAWLWAGLAAIGVAGAVALWPKSNALPAVSATLPATTTAAFVAVEGMDQLGQHGLQSLAQVLPADVTASWLDPGTRKSLFGLDPLDPASWQKAGIDAKRGIASVWDNATGVSPVAVAAVADAAANDAWWRAQFAGVPAEPFPHGPPAAWEAQHGTSQVSLRVRTAARDDWRAVQALAMPQEVTAGAGLGAWQAASGPTLDADPVFKAAMEGLPDGPRAVAYVQFSRMVRLVWPGDDPKLLDRVDAWLARSWRASGMWWTPGKAGMRLVATTTGVETLRKALETDTPVDPVVDALPAKAALAARWSVNLREVLDAIAEQLPPELPEAKTGFASARLALPLAMGIGETEFGGALTGHFAVAVQGPLQRDSFQFCLVVGLRDPAKAADLLTRLAGKLNWPLEQTADGWRLEYAGLGLTIRATPDVWVIGNTGAAAAAEDAPWKAELRTDAVLAVSLEAAALYDAWARLVGSPAKPGAATGRWSLTVQRTQTGLLALGEFP